jgi:hypothetical protein
MEKSPRFKIVEDGPSRFVLVDNESDDPAPVYATMEEAMAAARVARRGAQP